MTNAVIYSGGYWLILFGQSWVTVKGDIWRQVPGKVDVETTIKRSTGSKPEPTAPESPESGAE